MPIADAPQIDDYLINGPLGKGAMGTVWRATHLGTKAEVALKFLPSGLLRLRQGPRPL